MASMTSLVLSLWSVIFGILYFLGLGGGEEILLSLEEAEDEESELNEEAWEYECYKSEYEEEGNT